jgi:hypothetical protein
MRDFYLWFYGDPLAMALRVSTVQFLLMALIPLCFLVAALVAWSDRKSSLAWLVTSFLTFGLLGYFLRSEARVEANDIRSILIQPGFVVSISSDNSALWLAPPLLQSTDSIRAFGRSVAPAQHVDWQVSVDLDLIPEIEEALRTEPQLLASLTAASR